MADRYAPHHPAVIGRTCRQGVARWLPLALVGQLLLSFSTPPAASHAPSHAPPDGPALANDTTLYAPSLTVQGLFCLPLPTRRDTPASCTATSLHIDHPRLIVGEGPERLCFSARRARFSGVRFRSANLRGLLLGSLPIATPTSAVPPLPIPYLTLTHVAARGIALEATSVTAERITLTRHQSCL